MARLSARLRIVLLGGLWLLANLAWLHTDHLLRDGDEEGHVGAAELLAADLPHQGGAFLHAIWRGDLGEYPPLYPALVALWWSLMGGGQPGRVVVRALNLLWPLLAALAVRRIAPAEQRTLALALTLVTPALCGLGRHFMPEGALVAAVALVALAAWEARQRPSWTAALGLGSALGIALLLKQTALLYLLGPLLWALPALRQRTLASLGMAALLAGPWYLTHLQDQGAYLQQSLDTGGDADPPPLAVLLYYPALLLWSEAGPILLALLLLGCGRGLRAVQPSVRFGLLWLGMGLLVLTLTPRRYPRLLAPLLPAVALVASAADHRRAQRPPLGWLGVAGSAAWITVASTVWTQPPLPSPLNVDDGCLQRWLRPPSPTDFGLAAVSTAIRDQQAEVVWVSDAPEVPCSIQTTHPWLDHLGPYLRREGLEVRLLQPPTPPPSGPRVLQVHWKAGGLTAGFELHPPPLP